MRLKIILATAALVAVTGSGAAYAATGSGRSQHGSGTTSCSLAVASLPELTEVRQAAQKRYADLRRAHPGDAAHSKTVLLAGIDQEQAVLDEQSLVNSFPRCFPATQAANAPGEILDALNVIHFDRAQMRFAH